MLLILLSVSILLILLIFLSRERLHDFLEYPRNFLAHLESSSRYKEICKTFVFSDEILLVNCYYVQNVWDII